jgi:POT family proton-dependent oligopeptide transporter
MATSLNLFAQHNVNLSFNLFSHSACTCSTGFPSSTRTSTRSGSCLSPVLVLIYNSLGRVGKDPSIAFKFALGFAAVAVGFFMYGVGAALGGQRPGVVVDMVWGYGWYSLGEMLVSGWAWR